MAKYLYKLGQWSMNHAKAVIAAALILLLVMGGLVLGYGFEFDEDLSIPGTSSQDTIEMMKEEFPEVGNAGGQILLVHKAPEGKTLMDPDVAEKLNEVVQRVQEDKAVEAVYTPDMLMNYNKDQTIAYSMVMYDTVAAEVSEKSIAHVKEAAQITEDAGIQTELSGDVEVHPFKMEMATEVLGVLAAFLILFFTFGSLLVAGMPIITAGVGLGIGLLGVVFATNFTSISTVCLSLAAMLGLAVGIDYALFILSRFRQEHEKGYSIKQAVAIANGTAGSAVVFAGLTVVIALLGLSVPQIPFLSMMGYTAAVGVFLAIVIAVTVVPAVIYLFGDKMAPPAGRKKTVSERFTDRIKLSGKLMNGWARLVGKFPLVVALAGMVILGVISIPFFHMELGLPDDGFYGEDTDERQAYDLLKEAYGEGYHASLVVVAKAEEGGEVLSQLETLQADITAMDHVAYISNVIPKETGDMAVITLNPVTGPNDAETKELVNELRGADYEGMDLFVTGLTAVNIDTSDKLADALPVFAALIIGLAFVLLVVVFRSILVPLKAVLGFVLSLGATLGFVTWVIQDGNFYELFGFSTSGPVLNFLPIIVVGILFGLAMDYEMFLVSRMREEFTHSGDARKAVLAGLRDSGGVVTAAGLIMIAVFTGFMMAPDPMVKVMGLALAFGVLFDAFIVRMMIVPAVMLLMGKAAWYMPKWLDRIVPNIDVEGETIMNDMEAPERLKGKAAPNTKTVQQ
ncbi:MMPL family transporter [Planococcus glaciei]|uniref:MMPL family transporter n=1 Tax=Planococcus glaciei TaxID=459472 RepID=A0A7H8Q7W2_9BACL|nr:MMPL family transporter [Planococcus glaciei]QKX50007.1 MMPL family transporter [Planococcus glaciei]